MIFACLALMAIPASAQNADIRLTVDTDNPMHEVNPFVYGHFYEHIYHSANGGLWGEMVWNRSFELNMTGMGEWTIEGDEINQSAMINDVQLLFGDESWTDYELTLQGKKTRGAEGFMVVVRVQDEDSFYWLNLGGWGNTRHTFEKENNNNRGPVGEETRGRIQDDRWYDIRIRCEGNRIQGWLDGEEVASLTDTNNAFTSGKVGLASWGTHVSYRNIQVKSLDGERVLFEGLPEVPDKDFGVDFWEKFGDGKASRVMDGLNNQYSLEIHSGENATGIVQNDFQFFPQQYTGSVWMKGSLPEGIRLELLDGERVLGSVKLGPPTGEWAEYPFAMNALDSTNDGSVRIAVLGEGSVRLDHLNMMGANAKATGGFRPDLLEAVRGLRPPIIRWPGGCFASVYLWKDAIGPQHARRIYPAYMWEDQDINSLGTDEFIQLCKEVDSEPMLVINTGVLEAGCGAPGQFRLPSDEDYLPYALEWLEYCNGDISTPMGKLRAENGHPEPYNIVYWELDNETWAAGSAAYIEKVLEFAPALRAKAEGLGTPIKIIACGGNRFDMRWNRDVIDACAPLIDYISIHNYESPDNFDSGVGRYEELLIELAEYIGQSQNPDMEIYNSEWNAQSTDWRTGLYAGGLLNAYERQGKKFTIGGPALFLRHTSAGGWDNAFINFDHTGWFPAPNYVVMKLWWDNYASQFLPIDGDQDGCNIVATKSEDGGTLVLKAVNPLNEAKSVQVTLDGGFSADMASMQIVAPGSLRARNTLEDPIAVQPEKGDVTLRGNRVSFELPAYSTGVISLN